MYGSLSRAVYYRHQLKRSMPFSVLLTKVTNLKSKMAFKEAVNDLV
jgi:hypothetical protein